MKRLGDVRRSPSRIVTAVLVLAVAISFASTGAAPANDADLGLVPVGTLDRYPDDIAAILGDGIYPANMNDPKATPDRRNLYNGTILVFPEVRQLWQLFFDSIWGGGTVVAVRDLDSLRLEKTFRIAQDLGPSRMAEWMHTIDPGKRVFFMDRLYTTIIEVDLKTHAMKQHAVAPLSMDFFGTTQFGGFVYDAKDNALLALYGQMQSTTAANVNTYLTRLDLDTKSWEIRLVRSCNGPLPPSDDRGQHLFALLLTQDNVYIPCQRAGLTATVVRIPRAELLLPASEEDVAVGPVQLEDSVVDQVGRRILLSTSGGELWSFDADTMSFVGVVATMDTATRYTRLALGVDPLTGRVFFLSAAYGLAILEGRFFPLPQPRLYPQHKSQANERIWSDPTTGRIFVLKGLDGGRDRSYSIFNVGKAPTPPPDPDPDRNTVDRDEQPGVTDRRYFANASGYGARAILANGVIPVAPAPSVASASPTAQIFADHFAPDCGFSDRELIAGRVTKSEYDTGSTAANASAIVLDDRTKLDIESPSRCDVVVKNPAGIFRGIFSVAPRVLDNSDPEKPRWTLKAASCASSTDGDAESAESSDTRTGLGKGAVDCPLPGGELRASASASLVGAVRVGRAFSETVVKTGKKGVQSEVVSAAEDIDIASGLIRIAEIRSIASSVSNGRPKKDSMSDHKVLIRGVRVDGQPICGDECDPKAVVDALNRVVTGRAQFRIASGLDRRLLKGTDGGALTAVQKSVQRQASDQALIGDFTTDVPALEFVVYNDNVEWGRARQIYQFAGVASSATYNISLIPSGQGNDDDDDTGDAGGDLGEASSDTPLGFLSAPGDEQPPPAATDDDGGSGLLRRIRDAGLALARGVRLFFESPRHALLLLTGWCLFSLPAAMARRRRLLTEARSG